MKKTQERVLHIIKEILPWIIFPCASFYLMETFHHNPFANMNVRVQFLNIVIFIAVALFLWMVTGSRKWALRIQSIISLIVGVADYYVIAFRGTPILPWDISSRRSLSYM